MRAGELLAVKKKFLGKDCRLSIKLGDGVVVDVPMVPLSKIEWAPPPSAPAHILRDIVITTDVSPKAKPE